MPAVQGGNGQKIQNAELQADQRHHQCQTGQAGARRFFDECGDLDRTADLVHGNVASKHVAEEAKCGHGNRAQPLGAPDDGVYRSVFLLHHRRRDSDQPPFIFLPVLRQYFQGQHHPIAIDGDRQCLPFGLLNLLRDLVPTINRHTVDIHDAVPGQHPGLLGRIPRRDESGDRLDQRPPAEGFVAKKGCHGHVYRHRKPFPFKCEIDIVPGNCRGFYESIDIGPGDCVVGTHPHHSVPRAKPGLLRCRSFTDRRDQRRLKVIGRGIHTQHVDQGHDQ